MVAVLNFKEDRNMTDLAICATAPVTFEFVSHTLRVVLRDGEPWFVAADVCAALDHSDTSMAIRRLDDDEKGTSSVCTPGGSQQMTIINESGLYSLILTSRKPEAKRFKKWVTSEVLPAIRKTGRYETQNAPVAEETLSPAQYHDLKRRVAMIGSHFHYSQVAPCNAWSFLRRSMGVASAHQIPASRYEEARRILDDLNQAAFAFKSQVMECERRFFKRRFGAVPELSAIEQDPPQIALRG